MISTGGCWQLQGYYHKKNKVQTPVILDSEVVLIYHVPILIYKAAGSEESG